MRRRTATVTAGAVLALAAMTGTAVAVAAGPPMPDFSGKSLMTVFNQLDYRTRVEVHDDSGFDRNVLWPPSWKVCTQSPAKGAALNGQTVTIGVVKKAEKCPGQKALHS
ncbi:hypothetical protein ABT160_04995 [Streptomyces sp. NPDC001941]|uniref:hypothetical protein n=1 Tax=Streptomyces sp. NPDC001941 TaxID=3154659 RepID=UPI00332AC240